MSTYISIFALGCLSGYVSYELYISFNKWLNTTRTDNSNTLLSTKKPVSWKYKASRPILIGKACFK